ncbi:MAG: MFS transporter [Chloroflexota bacterium]|nr:MFS transporter [Chloroflexota bacterium]
MTPFHRLLAASAVSNFGDGLRLTALPLLAASLTRDPTAVAALTALNSLPWAIFGLVGGAIVDRVHRVRLLVAVQLLRLVIIGALAALVWTNNASLLLVYVVAFAIGTGELLADTTMQTILPTVVPRDRLESANGRLYATHTITNDFVGPPVGSVLFAAVNAAPFAVNALTWGAGALLLTGLAGAQAAAGRARASVRQDVPAGARYLFGHPMLRVLLVWSVFVNAALTAFGSIYVLYALEVLRVDEAAYGVLAAAAGAGGATGTLLAGRLVRLIGRSRVVQAGSVTAGAAGVAAGLVDSAVVVGGLMFLLTAAAGAVVIVLTSLRQTIVPGPMLGRVIATTRAFGYGAIPLGALLGGWLAAQFGLSAPFIVGGSVVIIAGLAIRRWVSPRAIEAARAAAGEG